MNSRQSVSVNLTAVQAVRKAVLLVAILLGAAFVVVGDSRWASGTLAHESIEWFGLILIVVCILGRTLCTLYIGGRKIESLVQIGPYSVSRNPLYFFSILGAIGAGAQLGSLVLAFATGFVVWLIFLIVIFKEEQVLTERFGAAYADYLAQVPRLFPRMTLWKDVEKIEVNPRLVRMTALDASVFLLSVPLAEGFEYLHDAGILPTWFILP
ncbi:MAG: isoprenylcysteine carboxylmethyltransferase family protein [Xanthobacteraceae bacterium]|nr:isoprenylcysteine carboxylmethyltransferase family protein [Xanthobacteraceae bacterium]QYK44681.1 MAG: isoprenylcysteine carboxylmethyltransferase family protein [Xanthobacteraceae bacterium]